MTTAEIRRGVMIAVVSGSALAVLGVVFGATWASKLDTSTYEHDQAIRRENAIRDSAWKAEKDRTDKMIVAELNVILCAVKPGDSQCFLKKQSP